MSTPPPNPSRLSLFLAELKRRHVVRFGLGYAAVAFVLLQLAEIIFPAFEIGETGVRVLVVVVALLFPPALVVAWIFDITARGIERTERPPVGARPGLLPQMALLLVTIAVALGIGAWLFTQGLLQGPSAAVASAGEEPTLVAYRPGQPIRSLAVLPFVDFSAGTGEDYFTAGMHEELIAQLSQIPGLRVVSRTSVQRYAGTDVSVPRIGRDLQVDAVLEGSVRRSGDQVRITVQLIHAASDSHLWTQQYDRTLENVLALQSEVALDVARQIQAELAPEEAEFLQQVATRTVDPEAQDAYLRGRFEADKGTPEGLAAAQQLFQAAVEEDSSFAPALAGLAGTRLLLGMADSAVSLDEMERAAVEAERAVALDSTYEEAWEVLSLIRDGMKPEGPLFVFSHPLRETGLPAEPTAASPAPSPPDTSWFRSLTQLGRTIEEQMRARTLGIRHDADLGRFMGARGLIAAGRFRDAVDMLSEVVNAAPDMAPAWELLARARVATGDPEAAVESMERWSSLGVEGAPRADDVASLRQAVAQEGERGYWTWQLGRLNERRAAGAPVSSVDLAAARAGSGDPDGAFAALDEASAHGDRALVLLQREPVWDVLRGDPRFADIARRSRAVRVQPPPREPTGPGRR